MGDTRNAYNILVGKTEDNIRMDLRETRWEGVNWMYLDQKREE
jgi:hypothetical protein